jgi:hypothetical protein
MESTARIATIDSDANAARGISKAVWRADRGLAKHSCQCTEAEVQSESISRRVTADEGTRIKNKTLVIAWVTYQVALLTSNNILVVQLCVHCAQASHSPR